MPVLRTSVMLLSVLLLSLLFVSCAQPPAERGFSVSSYNDHLYRITVHQPFEYNVFLSVGSDGVLLVDTGIQGTEDTLMAAIRTITQGPIDKIILTHTHPDHTGGMNAMPDDAMVYVHEDGLTSTYFSLPERQTFSQPSVPIEQETEIEFNGDTIRMIPLPKGHGVDEILVHFTDSNVLCIGSRAIIEGYPYVEITQGGSMQEVIDRLEILANDYPGTIFASAHGIDPDRDMLMRYHDALVENLAVVNRELDAGKTVEEIIADSSLAPWDSLADSFISHELWVNYVKRSRGETVEAKPSVCEVLTRVLEADGIDMMVARYQEMRESNPEAYDYGEAQLNRLGYELMYRDRYDEAKTVLRLNMEQFPESANVYDSYGEVHLLMGDTTTAIQYYRQALEVDSTYANARRVLESLGAEIL